ncbi:MAG: type I-E CRISPR-associated endoribonuclease Cas2 [Anaerolineaceae bacterium]|nr:type I-E CRISPR-associated endoribonuclease Cas2 [Anaerolineaceae bacterium]
MIVMVLEKVSASARGELTRWLLEVRSGVFIGHITARVRDKLWEKCIKNSPTGGVLQAWSSNNEQHFQMRISGDTSRWVVYEEGLQLIKIPGEQAKFTKRKSKASQKEQKKDILNETQ